MDDTGIMKPHPPKKKEFKPVLIRIGVWTCLVGTFASAVFIAVGSAKKPSAEVQLPQIHDEQNISVLGADQFARNFAYFYLSQDKESVKSFLADGFELKELQHLKKVQVKSVVAWGSHQEGNKVDILVKARVHDGESEQDVFLSVPIVMGENPGEYGVYKLPSFVPPPGRPKAPNPNENLSGEPLTNHPEEEKIKSIIDSFFRFYTEGESQDLALLFYDGKTKTRTTFSTQQSKYSGIDNLELRNVGNKVQANVTIWLELQGMKALQDYTFVFVKKGDEWKIESMEIGG